MSHTYHSFCRSVILVTFESDYSEANSVHNVYFPSSVTPVSVSCNVLLVCFLTANIQGVLMEALQLVF
jgi:hypothetical protein